jgi:hypothetical protein
LLRYANLNSRYQTGLNHALDEAINASGQQAALDIGGVHKIDEIPYDFIRKRLSVIGVLTLIHAAHDEEHSSADVLKRFREETAKHGDDRTTDSRRPLAG